MIDKNKFKDYNIILINLDGLRRNKVKLCPTLKALSENSLYFSNIDTVAPYTFASLHALFSGLYPSTNGVNAYYNMFKFKKNNITTLPQLFKKLDYYTCCDINSKSVMPEQGYDEYVVYDEKIINFTKRHIELIKKLSNKKFFLFLQNTETHNNLVRTIIEKYKNKTSDEDYFADTERNDQVYDSHLGATDNYISKIKETLQELKIDDKTILILFSDHGTSIGEKIGEKFYGVFLYEYTLNVFAIFDIPGVSPKTINASCSTIDIFPTLCDLFNIPEENFDPKQGNSLLNLLDDTNFTNNELFAETGGLYGPWPSPKKHNVFCVKINQKKLIYNDTPQTWEFYDLNNDPTENKNIYNQKSNDILFFKKRLDYYLKINNIKTNFHL